MSWIFGDAFLGNIAPDGSRSTDTRFIRNSLIVRRGSSLSSWSSAGSAPTALVSSADPAEFDWPGGGYVDDGALHVFMLGFRSGPSGAWDFRYRRSVVVTLALPSFALQPVSAAPDASSRVEWGSWVLRADDATYVYGVEDLGSVKYVHVARIRGGSGLWQYWTGDSWSNNPAASSRVLSGVSNQFSIVRVGGGYQLISQDPGFSRDISAYAAQSPVGPFSGKHVIYTTPNWGTGTFTYNALAHPEQGTGTGLLVSYNVNFLDASSNYLNAEIYRPRFVRVPLSCFAAAVR